MKQRNGARSSKTPVFEPLFKRGRVGQDRGEFPPTNPHRGDIDVATTALTGIVAGGADVGSADAAVTTTTTSLLTGIVAARGRTSAGQWKRKRKRCPRPGHVSCTLAQELEEDRKTKPEGFDDRFAALAQICTLMLQPALSALELIGRPRGERWDF